jgi:hypothetical protein
MANRLCGNCAQLVWTTASRNAIHVFFYEKPFFSQGFLDYHFLFFRSMDAVAKSYLYHLKKQFPKDISGLVLDYICWPVHSCFWNSHSDLVIVVKRKWGKRKKTPVYKCTVFPSKRFIISENLNATIRATVPAETFYCFVDKQDQLRDCFGKSLREMRVKRFVVCLHCKCTEILLHFCTEEGSTQQLCTKCANKSLECS